MCDVELVSDVLRLSDYTVQLLLLYRIHKVLPPPRDDDFTFTYSHDFIVFYEVGKDVGGDARD